MRQIAGERFPDAFPSKEALTALTARVLVFNPRSSSDLLATLQVRVGWCASVAGADGTV